MAQGNTGGTGGNGGPKKSPGVAAIAVAILVAIVVLGLIGDFEGIKDALAMLAGSILFLLVVLRLAGRQILTWTHPMTNSWNGNTRCPHCGSTVYSVSVQRRRYVSDRTKTPKQKAKSAFGELFSRLTFGTSDAVLGFFGNADASRKHDARATCRNCGFTWTIHNGGL